jgi:hypothetical protein
MNPVANAFFTVHFDDDFVSECLCWFFHFISICLQNAARQDDSGRAGDWWFLCLTVGQRARRLIFDVGLIEYSVQFSNIVRDHLTFRAARYMTTITNNVQALFASTIFALASIYWVRLVFVPYCRFTFLRNLATRKKIANFAATCILVAQEKRITSHLLKSKCYYFTEFTHLYFLPNCRPTSTIQHERATGWFLCFTVGQRARRLIFVVGPTNAETHKFLLVPFKGGRPNL